MKAKIEILNQPLLRKCANILTQLALCCLSAWLSLPGHVTKIQSLWNLVQSALLAVRAGLSVSQTSLLHLLRNKRHLVGIVLLTVGVGSIYAHQFLFDPYVEPHDVCRLLHFTPEQCVKETGWCYMSWFYYWHTIRFCVAAIFGSVGLILFVPTKYSLSFIPFSILQALGWVGIMHYSLFARSFETYHAIPHWTIIVIGFSLGFAIVMSADYLLYWFNHKALGNWQRFVGVSEMNLPAEVKEPMYKTLAKEFREIQKTI